MLDKYVPLQLTDNVLSDSDLEAARKNYGVDTWPGAVFITAEGKVLGRVTHLIEPDDMLAILQKANVRAQRE